MQKLKTYVFSTIVILIISFSDEAESKSMEIDRRLERAVEAWRNVTSLAQADTDTDTDTSDTVGSNRQAVVSGGITDPKTGIKYGCYWSKCWRSCEKGQQILDSRPTAHDPHDVRDLCAYGDDGNHWCYSDLGFCTYASGCRDAVKWGCHGTGTEPGRDVGTGCPGFEGYPCDKKTKQSFGCSKTWSLCWRSCDSKEKNCHYKAPDGLGFCYVAAGHCSFNKRCIVATALECSPPGWFDFQRGDPNWPHKSLRPDLRAVNIKIGNRRNNKRSSSSFA